MTIFKLPDLGEGLPDAIIREWYVNVGDQITADQPMVAMETAKALVDVPAPQDGVIEKLFGEVGDTIETGQPLLAFASKAGATTDTAAAIETRADSGTVVGKITENNTIISESAMGIAHKAQTHNKKITPAIHSLAKRLGVDLATISSQNNRITRADVVAAAKNHSSTSQSTNQPTSKSNLSPMERAMVLSMSASHKSVVPVTLIDDIDLGADKPVNLTLRIIQALVAACQAEPKLNAYFNDQDLLLTKQDDINLGIAMDMPHGLYVPVLRQVQHLDANNIREKIQLFKTQAADKSLAQDDLHGATLVLSNFGSIAGRYANPIITPPTVAIIGVGKLYTQVTLNSDNQCENHWILPVSITIDHRVITGGEAARFLAALKNTLQAG